MNHPRSPIGAALVVATVVLFVAGIIVSWHVLRQDGYLTAAIAPATTSTGPAAATSTTSSGITSTGPSGPPNPSQTGSAIAPSLPPSPQPGVLAPGQAPGQPPNPRSTTIAGGQSPAAPVSGLPMQLTIPAVNIDASVESVGLVNGAMDVPSDVWDVAWLDTGPRPGEVGNAVIDGHLDSTTGPAVFLWLRNLQVGDYIYVTANTGVRSTFVVTGMDNYDVNNAPLEQIFGPTQNHDLNLITCSGIWDMQKHMYNERLVVYSRLLTSANTASTHPTSGQT